MFDKNIISGKINNSIEALKKGVFDSGKSTLSPSKPISPAREGGHPLAYQYPQGVNRNYFFSSNLRQLNHYEKLDHLVQVLDIVKIGLQYKRLQLNSYEWRIVPIDPSDKGDYTKEIEILTNFFRKPDRQRSFRRWMSKQIYNYVVYDAVSIFKRRNNAGELIALDCVDGKTIKPLVDASGRIPEYPNPAYQQIIQGRPEVNLTTKDLIYCPFNESIDSLSGCSAVENVMIATNTYLRSQGHNLLYFTDGVSTSAGLISWGQDDLKSGEIESLEAEFNYKMQISKNRHYAPFVPKGTQIIRLMDFSFNLEFTEHIIKVMCASLNCPQSLFISMLNRSTSQTLDSQQEDDIVISELLMFEDIFFDVIQEEFTPKYPRCKHLKFDFLKDQFVDPKLILQQVIQSVEKGIISINEARIKLGDTPKEGLDDNYVMTSTGAILAKELGNQNEILGKQQGINNE